MDYGLLTTDYQLLTTEFRLNQIAQSLSINRLTFKLRTYRFHYRAHILHRRSRYLRDRIIDCPRNFFIARRRREIALNDEGFSFFFLSEFLAITGSKLLGCVPALFEQSVEHL